MERVVFINGNRWKKDIPLFVIATVDLMLFPFSIRRVRHIIDIVEVIGDFVDLAIDDMDMIFRIDHNI